MSRIEGDSTAMPIGGPHGDDIQNFPAAHNLLQTAQQVYNNLPGGPAEQDAKDYNLVTQAIKGAPKKVSEVAKADGNGTAAAGLVQTAMIAQSSGSESGAGPGPHGGGETPEQKAAQAAKEAKERAQNAAAAAAAAAQESALEAEFQEAMQADSEARMRALEMKGLVAGSAVNAVLAGFRALQKNKGKQKEHDYVEKMTEKRDFLREFYKAAKNAPHPDDLQRFSEGSHTEIYEVMGGRLHGEGAHFSLWAPHAKAVSVVGDFNDWDTTQHPMTRAEGGVWTARIAEASEGTRYKFAVTSRGGGVTLKADPYALYAEKRPGNASILTSLDFDWTDEAWRANQKPFADQPMHIYEVHLGSWRPECTTYREVAHALIDYCHEMHYTHVELMPLTEHPLDESWGYQVTGYYAVTSRFGTPRDFQYLVNALHNAGIGVFFDWVPGHFPVDLFSLSTLDGTPLYESEFHPEWTTWTFDYGKKEVINFLLGSACFWLEVMHLDGLRVDAVYSILERGGEKGRAFLTRLNKVIHKRFPHAITIAEDTKGYPDLTRPLSEGGFGFDLKWNVGWTHDITRFLQAEEKVHSEIIHPFTFIFDDHFVTGLSHDDVAEEKIERVDHLPLLLGLKMTAPGKKLLFMGVEFGHKMWHCKTPLAFDLLAEEKHAAIHAYTKALGALYLATPALYEDEKGFAWHERDVPGYLSFFRLGKTSRVLCFHNYSDHPIEVETVSGALFTSDATEFGGSGILPRYVEKGKMTLPSLSTTIVFDGQKELPKTPRRD